MRYKGSVQAVLGLVAGPEIDPIADPNSEARETLDSEHNMVGSQNRGTPLYSSQNTRNPTKGNTKKVPRMLGSLHMLTEKILHDPPSFCVQGTWGHAGFCPFKLIGLL